MESKVKEVKGKVDNTDNGAVVEVDYTAKWEEAKENLLIQLRESLEQIEFHKTRATKIQGVVEVNDQLFLKEKNEEK